MMKKAEVVNSLPLIAKAIGRRYKVNVVIDESITTPHTDGKTICLPALKANGDATDVALLNAFLDHEAGHVRFSDFSVLLNHPTEDRNLFPLERFLTNVIEDPRIESLMERAYPGCRFNFEAAVCIETAEPEFQALLKKSIADMELVQVFCQGLLTRLFVDLLDRKPFRPLADRFWGEIRNRLGEQLADQALAIAKAGATGASSKEARDAALAIIRLLQFPNDPPPQITGMSIVHQNPDQNQDQSQDQGQGQGQGQDQSQGQGQSQGQDQDQGQSQGQGQGQGQVQGQSQNQSQDQGKNQCQDQDRGQGLGQSQDQSQGPVAGNSGSHTGKEAGIQAILNADEQVISALDAKTGTSAVLGKKLADRNQGRGRISDSDVHTTPWKGSAGKVQMLGLEKVARDVRLRLEDLLEQDKFEQWVPSKSGSRLRRSTVGLYDAGVETVFERRDELPVVDADIEVTFDISGSMSGGPLQAAKVATIAIGDALFGFDGVKYEVTAFDTAVFTFSPNWRVARQQIAGVPANGGTAYAPALYRGFDRLLASESSRKLLFLITDGDPSDMDAARDMVQYAVNRGVHIFGLSINGSLSGSMRAIFQNNCAAISDAKGIASVLGKMVEQAL